MRPPRVRAALERRILINYRVDPGVIADILPRPFRAIDVNGYAIAGICLIRLSRIRPAGGPPAPGISTENAAHRIAVQWDTPDGVASGVYIPGRHTNSRLTTLIGGRLFPGWHERAQFAVTERDSEFAVKVTGADGATRISVRAQLAGQVMRGSVFSDVASASRFFGCAPIGYSARPDGASLDGVELSCAGWNLRPLAVDEITSSYFDDPGRFPPGTLALDSAFLMRDLATTWSPLPRLRVPGASAGASARRSSVGFADRTA